MMALVAAALQTTLLGFRVRIVDPVWLWVSPLASPPAPRPPGVSGGDGGAPFPASAGPARAGPSRGGASQGVLRGGLLGICLSLLSVAAAGPQCGERTEIVKRSGIDLVVALDASTSMLARDVKPRGWSAPRWR